MKLYLLTHIDGKNKTRFIDRYRSRAGAERGMDQVSRKGPNVLGAFFPKAMRRPLAPWTLFITPIELNI